MLSFPERERSIPNFYAGGDGTWQSEPRNQLIAFRVTLAEARKIREKVRRSGLSQQEYLLRAALEQQILVIHELKAHPRRNCAPGEKT